MKKIISLALAAVMLLGAVPMVNAAEVTENHDYSNGTAITLVGTGTEEYTVTVPAKMVPGDTGTVKAEGTWASGKVLHVTAPVSVTLTYGAQSLTADIEGGCMILPGSDVDTVTGEGGVSVSRYVYDSNNNYYTKVLFGTWEGTLNYTVNLVETSLSKGDANGDGMLSQADADYIEGILSGKVTLTDEESAAVLARADMDGNGHLAVDDASTIALILCGKSPIV